ncbi:MAG: hypothetical protein UX04_C0006G0027 [Microgenomates group bacterium GW2011_GWF2_45_18]|nr:MAG: hypothetical protein UW18_C0006G0027 [Microgenomates group bacterium GW2011_GWF1_44_10]KKU01492.1 MAG: hypothetical protein UX04_C0006G0027 [Microgenomates group bacterium GW2011_GWF2_45_18]OGJ40576.1 MAG: hypothetical protein A2378_01825 [Candidatus Pacebacteria bacterium RIFOXYB1_FULL_44_10]HAX01594.1 hypothetical protein [Candidatus Paceibacterota bacterium]
MIGVTLVSINFTDLQKGTISLLKGVKETLLATVFFGIFYWPLNEWIVEKVDWIVEKVDWIVVSFITKLTAIVLFLLLSRFQKRSLAIKALNNKLFFLLATVGILETIGILSVSFGQSFGDGIIVNPISSSLTVVTVALAMIFSKERISRVQGLGIAMTVMGIVMTAM